LARVLCSTEKRTAIELPANIKNGKKFSENAWLTCHCEPNMSMIRHYQADPECRRHKTKYWKCKITGVCRSVTRLIQQYKYAQINLKRPRLRRPTCVINVLQEMNVSITDSTEHNNTTNAKKKTSRIIRYAVQQSMCW
jgi:hypothetical protein